MGFAPKRLKDMAKGLDAKAAARAAAEEAQVGPLADLMAAAEAYKKATGNDVSVRIKAKGKKARRLK
jgi:hypothetical protein